MALNVDRIELTQPGTNGQVTYNLAAGFDPKAIIIFGTPQTADGTIASWAYGFGFGTYRGGSVAQRCVTMRGLDAATAADTYAETNSDAVFIMLTQSAGASSRDLEIDLVSMTNSGTPNVVLDWVNRHTTASIKIWMLVLGGSDISDALVGTADLLTSTTFHDETVASGFGKPDFLFMGSSTDIGSQPNPQFSIGFGKQGEAGRCFAFTQTDGNTASITASSQRSDKILRKIAPGGGSDESIGQLDTVAANWPTDGFRIVTDANPSFNVQFPYLALKGTFQSATGNGSAPITGTPPVVQDLACGFAPALGFIMGWNLAAKTTIDISSADAIAFGMGATDGTDEAWAGFTEDDGAGTMDSNQQRTNTKVIRNYNQAGVLQSEADGSFSGNNFRLSWNDIDTVAREYQWFALGSAAGGGTNHTQNPADSVTMSDAVVFDLVRGIADTLALADAQARDVGKALADTVGVADSLTSAKDVPLAPADSVTFSDNLSSSKAIPLSPADSVTMSDGITLERGLGPSDTVGIADAVVFDRAIQLSDGVSMSDLATFARELLFGDTLGLADSATPLITKVVNVDDSVSVSDDFQRVLDYVRTPSDSITPSDSVSTAKNVPLLPADSVTMSDNASTERGLTRQFDDTLGLADSMTFVVDHAISVDDTLPLTDSTVFSREVTLEDALSLADALALSYGLSAADVLAISDLADPVLESGATDHVLNFDDSVTVADALSFIRDLRKNESISVSDAVERRLNGVLLDDGAVAVIRQGIIYIGRF